ncbi:MAG: hypothetical protein ACXABY_32655, partial [Candidatus Thorarchaeota archaeon]
MAIADGITLEQTILGHALNSRSCFEFFVSEVDYHHFSAPNHKVLAFCLKQMGAIGINKPDEDTFQLVVNGYPGEEEKDYGGTEYLRQLRSAFLEPTENYEKFVEQLKIQAVKRMLGSQRLNEIVTATNDPTTTISQIKKILNKMVVDVEEASTIGYNFLDMGQLGSQYLDEIKDRENRVFCTTGFDSIDNRLTEGFAPKKITVLAGFTGMGKS